MPYEHQVRVDAVGTHRFTERRADHRLGAVRLVRGVLRVEDHEVGIVQRWDREQARLANPAWLWLSCLGSLAIIFATYVFGGDEIHWWLTNSVDRTTIFAQLLLHSDLAIWLVVAADPASARASGRRVTEVPGDLVESLAGRHRRIPAQHAGG